MSDLKTLWIRGCLAGAGLSPADAAAVHFGACGGSGEPLGAVRCEDLNGHDREVRRVDDEAGLNFLLTDPQELDNLVVDIERVRQ